MSEITINGYHEGINRDLSKHVEQTTTMWDNENFRMNTQEGGTYGVIENVDGNSAFLNFNNIAAQRYKRWYNYPTQGLQAMAGVTFRF